MRGIALSRRRASRREAMLLDRADAGAFEEIVVHLRRHPAQGARRGLPYWGSLSRCREQVATFAGASVDLPILSPPSGVDGAREVILAFRR